MLCVRADQSSIMMISIGNKHFIESKYIVEILGAMDTQRDRTKHRAAASGMLIDATGGRRAKSIIKLKSRHVVLSALAAETLKSRLEKNTHSALSGKRPKSRHNHKKKYLRESKPSEFDDRRLEPDRRRFSYTQYVPERRSGIERRAKNGKFQHEIKA